MLYYILISVVIVAEIVITCELCAKLLKLDKNCKKTNEFLDEAKPKLKDITKTGLKISEQLVELAPYWVKTFQSKLENFAINNLKNVLIGIGIWAIRRKIHNKN